MISSESFRNIGGIETAALFVWEIKPYRSSEGYDLVNLYISLTTSIENSQTSNFL
jgi:hypothetical protein